MALFGKLFGAPCSPSAAPLPSHRPSAAPPEGDCMWCAGGMMIEHPLVVPHVTRIEGSEDGIRGLAKALVLQLLLDCKATQS